VERVLPNTAAEKAGLKEGDVILRFDGKPIEKHTDLPRVVGNTKPNQKVTVQIWRNGAQRDIGLTLGETEPDRVAQRGGDRKAAEEKKAGSANALGLVVSDLTEARRKELKVEGGVLVDSTEGLAARAGVRQGDVILKLQTTDVTSAKQLNDLVSKLDLKKVTAVLVKRGEVSQYITIRPQ
jgi:serine protease Do